MVEGHQQTEQQLVLVVVGLELVLVLVRRGLGQSLLLLR